MAGSSDRTDGSRRAAASGTGRRRLLSREERQASILRAAARAFAGAGFAGTSMEDVAAEAGVTKLIVYRHFDSKEELYRTVLARTADRLREELRAGFVAPEDERRGVFSRAMLRVARDDPDGVRLLFVHARREPQFAAYADEHRRRAEALADELIAEFMIPDHLAHADPVVERWAARTIVRYLSESLLVWLDEGDPERDEEFVELATAGLVAMFTAWASPAGEPTGGEPGPHRVTRSADRAARSD